MSSKSNFLLKIHMEEEDNTSELTLNKEGHLFAFSNDECQEDFVLPTSKIVKIKDELANITDEEGSDTCYLEHDIEGRTIRSGNIDKITAVKESLLRNTTEEFMACIDGIKVNDYYIDNVKHKCNADFPIEVKKILSYTTNGVKFSDRVLSFMSHDEILKHSQMINNFIPFMSKEENDYIGYDYNEKKYKEYVNGELKCETITLNELLNREEEKEVEVPVEEEKVEDEEKEFSDLHLDNIEEREDDSIVLDDEEDEIEIINAVTDEEYERTIKNIDLQLEKLDGALKEEETLPEEVEDDNVSLEEREEITREIVESVRKSLHEIEETNNLIDEIDQNINRVKKEETSNEKVSLNELVNNALFKSLENYRINFNDTQKLVVEHLPYYEMTSKFDVIQIPEIELDKITLLPGYEIDFGKIKFYVDNLSHNKVDLVVASASSIVDRDGNKLKKGSHVILDTDSEYALRLNKNNAMETWTLRMEKSTFEKELRNIDYNKVMNLIVNLDSYQKLCNIERYELEKSVMLFINLVMEYHEEKKLDELYRILEKEPTLYEEFITKYNIEHALELKDYLPTYEKKKEFVTKLNYVNGLIEAKWLDYPRYIFESHNYFEGDSLLEAFESEINDNLKEKDFSDYLIKLFKEYKMFNNLDEVGKNNLNKCLEYLSLVYKNNPHIGEENKYKIEREFMIGATEEDMALLISKICRRGIKDYSLFVEYDAMLKEMYRLGELHYPIFSEGFGIEEIRNGGELYEF